MPLILASLVFAVALAALPSTEPPSEEDVRAYEAYVASLKGQGKRRRSSAQSTQSDGEKEQAELLSRNTGMKFECVLDGNKERGRGRGREKRLRRTTSVVFPISDDDNRPLKIDVNDSDHSRGRSLNCMPTRDRNQDQTEHISPTSSSSPLPLRRTSSVPSDLSLS